MVHTGISIDKESWAVLREEPLYSARFIDREGSEELALVTRVEELDAFLEASPPLTLNLTTWCSPQGTWVVALAYCLNPTWGGAKGGVFYLNPRQTADAEILQKFVRQESVPVIFLSADVSEHLTVGSVQPPQELAHWQQRIDKLHHALAGELFTGDYDPDFALAQQDFQARYRLHDLLAGVQQD